VTESAQRLVREDETSDDEGVVLPGAKAEVTFVSVERQPVRLESLLNEFKNVVQEVLIPPGMRGFVVALAAEPVALVAVSWAKVADISTEISAKDLNILFDE